MIGAEFYKVRWRRTSEGRIALAVEFLLPPETKMTDLGNLASIAADHLEAYAKFLGEPSTKPVVQGDADDAAQLDRVAAAVKVIESLTGKTIGQLTASSAAPTTAAVAPIAMK